MVKLLLYFKHNLSFIWNWVEKGNSIAFKILYGKKKCLIDSVLEKYGSSYSFRLLTVSDMPSLADFFVRQPESAYEYFKPHGFELSSLEAKQKDDSFIMIGAFDENQIIGYCFIRCFCNRQAFRGKIVDVSYQGKGIAKTMGQLTTEICKLMGFRLFATISKNNVKSIASSRAVNNVRIIKELPDNYIYVEYLMK